MRQTICFTCYRVALNEEGSAKPHLGQADQAGSDETHFNTPRGLAVDRFGNRYVSDEAGYVSDVINRRIVRVKLSYAAQETIPIE